MTRRMLIDATHQEETRAVVLDGHHLADFDFETSTKRQLKGNIYLAKVTRVEPSLQAAFVEYGGNRHGFLAFSEIHPDYYQIPAADRALLEDTEHDAAARAGERDADLDGANGHGESAEIDEDEERAELLDEQVRRRARLLRSYKIQEVVKRRQIMLVQVVKEERGNKGAALTTYLSLAGRYCVLMPNTARGGGISRKIMSLDDRRKLKEIVAELEVPQGMGLIIRTAGQERTRAEIRRDYEYLLRLWNEIRESTLQSIAPKLIYAEGDLIKRALRDLYTRDIEEVLVEGEDGYKSARRLMQMLMPSRARMVKRYEEEVPLFVKYRVEDQLDAMHSPTVQLHSGGSIVLHTTEALTAIDVNSGRSTRERHIDETALKTNLEAADEVARQLRLRDVAGLIVIDFIDMAEGRHQRAVEKRMRDALKIDRARIQVGRISQFGLLELSRQRLRASLQELSSQVCPHCAGLGIVRSTESCALESLRAVQEEGLKREASRIRLTLPGDVALYLLNQKREALSRLEEHYAMQVMVGVDQSLVPPAMRLEVLERHERIEVEAVTSAAVVTATEEVVESRETQPSHPVEARVANGHAPEPGRDEENDEGGGKRRRRRRRRRRRGGAEGAQLGAVESTSAAEPMSLSAARMQPDEADDEEAPTDLAGGDVGALPQATVDEREPEEVRAETVPVIAALPPAVDIGPAPVEFEAVETEALVPLAIQADRDEPGSAALSEVEEPKPAPKRRRRSSAEVAAAKSAARSPVKKPAPRRRATSKAAAAEPDEAAPASVAAAETPPAAARPRARRRKAAAATAADSRAVSAPEEQAAPAAQRNGAADRAASQPVAVEQPAPEPAGGAPQRPARRGWWNRSV